MLARMILSLIVVVALLTGEATAADRPAGDHVALKNGTRLRGLVFERSPQVVTLLVSEKSLRATQPRFHESALAKTVAEHKAGLEQLVERLQAEPKREAPAALTGFFREQLETAEADLAQANRFEPEFLWLTIPMRDVDRIEATAPDRRQLLAWAWAEQLERAETKPADEVARELKALAVSPVGWPLSLIERLPARGQSDDEWAARLAIVEFVFDRPLHFQGTGEVLVRADKPSELNIAQMIGDLLRRQLQSQFGDLLGEPQGAKGRDPQRDQAAVKEALRKAAQVAEAEPCRGFRVTRLDTINDVQQATISTQFSARMPNGSWQTIFQHIERADAKQARPDIQQRIEADPRIKQVLDLTRQLGGAADDTIQQALRFGAATMAAQQGCDREFAAFRETYLTSLAKPPLTWLRPQ